VTSPGADSSSRIPGTAARGAADIPVWADGLARWLDHGLQIPGTRLRVGFDALIGFIAPGAGDAVGAFASLAIFYLGFKLRVPKVILLRMLLNIAVDAVLGAVPLLGDVFDVFFRAADKNLALLRKHGGALRTPADAGDYALVGLGLLIALSLLLLPVLVGLALVRLAVGLGGDG
jgi:hypothetical protein